MSKRFSAAGNPTTTATTLRVLAEFVAFVLLLFVSRFLLRGYLGPVLDEECHIGGVAIDLLAHGIRFPLLVYVQNDYDNGSFYSALLAAASFSVLGRNVLALKLVTHVISAAGAVATLYLLRRCLAELGLVRRRARWTATAVLLIALALAPRVVTFPTMCTVGLGTPAEGSAMNTGLLLLFAWRLRRPSTLNTAGAWALVGLALYLNKATLPLLPVLGVAELLLGWPSAWRLLTALGGFVLGVSPELSTIAHQHGGGWTQILEKASRHSRDFPRPFLETMAALAEYRIELGVVWLMALVAGIILLLVAGRPAHAPGSTISRRHPSAPAVAITLALVLAATLVELAALTVMAQGGFDYYSIYMYPTLAVLLSVFIGALTERLESALGLTGGAAFGVAAVGLVAVLYRPYATSLGLTTLTSLWHNHDGAACSFRFAEGFRREYDRGLGLPGETREAHTINRCRSLSEPDQVLDCIGGIARDRQYHFGDRVEGDAPAALSASERRAYAFYHGMRRNGDASACDDFADAALKEQCRGAVHLECLFFADASMRLLHGTGAGRPHCPVSEPPMNGYWATRRSELMATPARGPLKFAERIGQDDLPACKPVFEACY